IVDAHHGELAAESRGSGLGTTMTVRMRAVPIPASFRPGDNLPSNQRRAGAPTAGPLQILLVDDHRDTVNVLKRLLTRIGYQVVTAETFRDALQLAATNDFDLLVSDIGLPDGNGFELLKEIRKRQRIDAIALS